MEGLERILSEHPFFATFPKEHRELLAGCAKNHRFNAGQFLFHEGDPANEFFLIRQGKIALEIMSSLQAEREQGWLGAVAAHRDHNVLLVADRECHWCSACAKARSGINP